MANNASWRFILTRAYDQKHIGELLQASSKQISVALNAAGSATFTYPMDAELADQLWPHQSGIKVYRIGSTGPQLIWSGFVNTISEDWDAMKLQVNCVGWLDRLSDRFLRAVYQVTGTADSGQIIFDLLQRANGGPPGGGVYEWPISTVTYVAPDGGTVYWPSGATPNTPSFMKVGSTQPNEGPGGATAYTTQLIPKKLEKGQGILQAIQDIIQTENGPDITVDPATRVVNVYRKYRRILPGVVFGYNWGPENISQFGREIDGSTVMNFMVASGNSGVEAAGVVDIASQQAYGPFEEFASLSDVPETEILASYAQAEVNIRKTPRVMYQVTPFPWTEQNSSPEPFVDYRVGDQVALVARRLPRLDVNQQVRIFGMEVGIDEEGNERLGQLSLYPS